MNIILTNEFHLTSAIVRPIDLGNGKVKISWKTAQRLKRELCGSSDCTCGGNFGERGGAYLDVINEDHNHSYIIDMQSSRI